MTRREAIVAVTTLTVGGTVLANSNNKMIADDFWRAWAVTVGKDIRLTVEGIYSQGGPGVVGVLKEINDPANPNALVLELELASLPGLWPQVIRPIPVQFVKKDIKRGELPEVIVKYPRGLAIKKMEAMDTEGGPKARK